MKINKVKKIAFVVGVFPAVSETFILDQVADLLDHGIDVDIYSFSKGDETYVSEKYKKYSMESRTYYLNMPTSYLKRLIYAMPRIWQVAFFRPKILLKVFSIREYGSNAYSLKLLFWVFPWIHNKNYDLVHCHFGTIANKYLLIRDILSHSFPIITTFYGYDVSHIFKQKGKNYYNKLQTVCSLYFVMSHNMKSRVVDYGFDAQKVVVLPVSIDVSIYPFQKRSCNVGEKVKICSVGRFVEKKGFDDLINALAIVKEKRPNSFQCDIVGGGVLEEELHKQVKNLSLDKEVNFKGYMKIENIVPWFLTKHLFVQPSKTAKNGDME